MPWAGGSRMGVLGVPLQQDQPQLRCCGVAQCLQCSSFRDFAGFALAGLLVKASCNHHSSSHGILHPLPACETANSRWHRQQNMWPQWRGDCRRCLKWRVSREEERVQEAGLPPCSPVALRGTVAGKGGLGCSCVGLLLGGSQMV